MQASLPLLEQMRANPQNDWTIRDVERLGRDYGLLIRQTKASSHVQLKHPNSVMILTIPAHRPIKPVYIRKLVRYIDDHGGKK